MQIAYNIIARNSKKVGESSHKLELKKGGLEFTL